jgi:pyruvate,orthophosphate dikinase
MPGMMDTVLNLGINDEVEQALAAHSGDAAYAADTRRRFRQQYTKVVGVHAPDDPWDQLENAVCAVFDSWNSPRAIAYRRHHGIADVGGTAVTVQAMVFGNLDDNSGTGVLFSRDPVTASSAPYGEWLPRGQGEDVVSGRCTPVSLSELAEQLPEVHRELLSAASLLEREFRDVQDIEFTVESGKLWLLQSRPAKRSAISAVYHALSMQQEGIVDVEDALSMISPKQLAAFMRPHLAAHAGAGAAVLSRGEVACPGLARGVVVDTADEAVEMADQRSDVILARPTTDPDDVHGIIAAAAVVTELGGATSHAAIVCRELNKPCVVACGPGMVETLRGRLVTVDATSGEILDGLLEIEAPSKDDARLALLASWIRATTGEPSRRLKDLIAAV